MTIEGGFHQTLGRSRISVFDAITIGYGNDSVSGTMRLNQDEDQDWSKGLRSRGGMPNDYISG